MWLILDSCSSIQFCNTFGFFSVSAALLLCVRLCAILYSVTFCRFWWDLRRAATKLLCGKTCVCRSVCNNQVLAAEDDNAVKQIRCYHTHFLSQKGYLHYGYHLNWAGLCAQNSCIQCTSYSSAMPLCHLLATYINMCELPIVVHPHMMHSCNAKH